MNKNTFQEIKEIFKDEKKFQQAAKKTSIAELKNPKVYRAFDRPIGAQIFEFERDNSKSVAEQLIAIWITMLYYEESNKESDDLQTLSEQLSSLDENQWKEALESTLIPLLYKRIANDCIRPEGYDSELAMENLISYLICGGMERSLAEDLQKSYAGMTLFLINKGYTHEEFIGFNEHKIIYFDYGMYGEQMNPLSKDNGR